VAKPSPEEVKQQVRLVGWGIVAVIALVFMLRAFKIDSVSGEQVGFLVNNMTGEITELPQAGQVIYSGLWNDFYTIDKRILDIDMGKAVGGKADAVKLKTRDGNDVFVDFTVFYEIHPDAATTVLLENGPQDAYQRRWVRDYARAICRYVFGELTTEEFYIAAERDKKMRQAEQELNELLQPHGLLVTQVAVQNFHFLRAYEQKITEKKLADQEVEQFKAQEAANVEAKVRYIAQAEGEKANALTRFDGELNQLIEQARGKSDRNRLEAQAYAQRVRPEAEAEFHKEKNEAEATLAHLDAEAAGVRALAQALIGSTGRNLVALEYVKRLQGLQLTGVPVLVEGVIGQFRHGREAAAAAGRSAALDAGTTGGN
jgi:regulator of protease activity HflC (stomatin/prohibitin superfamily)